MSARVALIADLELSASSSTSAGQSTSLADERRPRVPLLRRCREPYSALCGLRPRHRAVLRRSPRRDRTSVLRCVPCTDRELGAQAADSFLFKVRGATAATTWDVGHVSLLPRGELVYAPSARAKLCVARSASMHITSHGTPPSSAVSCHSLSACCFPGRSRFDYVVPCNYRHSATRRKDATLARVGLPPNSGNRGPTLRAQILNHKVGPTGWERTVRSHRVVPKLRSKIRAQMQARVSGPVCGAARARFMNRCSASICPHAVFWGVFARAARFTQLE